MHCMSGLLTRWQLERIVACYRQNFSLMTPHRLDAQAKRDSMQQAASIEGSRSMPIVPHLADLGARGAGSRNRQHSDCRRVSARARLRRAAQVLGLGDGVLGAHKPHGTQHGCIGACAACGSSANGAYSLWGIDILFRLAIFPHYLCQRHLIGPPCWQKVNPHCFLFPTNSQSFAELCPLMTQHDMDWGVATEEALCSGRHQLGIAPAPNARGVIQVKVSLWSATHISSPSSYEILLRLWYESKDVISPCEHACNYSAIFARKTSPDHQSQYGSCRSFTHAVFQARATSTPWPCGSAASPTVFMLLLKRQMGEGC